MSATSRGGKKSANNSKVTHPNSPSFIMEDVKLLFGGLTTPETGVEYDPGASAASRATTTTIQNDINPSTNTSSPFELSTGAADADSYHDFFRLQIAFDDVWAELRGCPRFC
jgi:hypothetical protein